MNSLDLFAQYLLAGIFLFAGLSKIFAYLRPAKAPHTEQDKSRMELPGKMVCAIALLEIAGALALVMPLHMWQPEILPRFAAAGLALLALAACEYRHSRKESAAPVVAVFLLALFVIIGQS